MKTNIDAIREVHGRIPLPAPGRLPGGWMEAYRQDVGALLARVDELVQSRSDAIRAGIERARADGRHVGRPRAEVDVERLAALWADGRGLSAIARIMGLPRTTVRTRLREAGLWPRI